MGTFTRLKTKKLNKVATYADPKTTNWKSVSVHLDKHICKPTGFPRLPPPVSQARFVVFLDSETLFAHQNPEGNRAFNIRKRIRLLHP